MRIENIVKLLVCLGVVGAMLHTSYILTNRVLWEVNNNDLGYHDTSAFANLKEQKCVSSGGHFDIEVQVEFGEHDNWAGAWYPLEDRLFLDRRAGMDIDTVSHEVYHMVESKMKEYNVQDPHYGAYMQGYWTACVWSIVEDELKKEKKGKLFKFYND